MRRSRRVCFQSKDYRFTNAEAFTYYRWTSPRNGGEPLLQLAEVELSDGIARPADYLSLFDNTSATRIDFEGDTPWVQFEFTGGNQRIRYYTLTSSATPGDPVTWVLQGSRNGRSWNVVDARIDETFPHRLQTRPFKVRSPGNYRFYRLEVYSNTGEPVTSLAEIELLA